MGFWDELYEEGGEYAAPQRIESPGYRAPDDTSPQAPAAPTEPIRLSGQVNGRDADANSAHDVVQLWRQQTGTPPPRNNQEAAAAFRSLAEFGKQYGFQIDPIAHDRLDKVTIRTPDGRTIGADLVVGAGGSNPSWGFSDNGAETGQVSAQPAAGGGGFSLAQYAPPVSSVGTPGHLGGSFKPYEYEDFVAPTLAEARTDPGYAFGASEAQQAVERSAALRGKLRTGGTLKDVGRYLGDYAATRYGDVFNRALTRNQANNQGRLAGFTANTNADLGYRNLNLGYTRAANDFSLGQGQLALGNRQADISRELGLGNLGLGWANHGLNADEQRFSQGYRLSDMGLRAAAIAGGYGSMYGANAADAMTGAANARAAGQVGSANAWASGLTNAANAGLGAYYASQYGKSGSDRRTNPYIQW